jgi:hypothetical protein
MSGDPKYYRYENRYRTFQNYACFVSKSEFYELYNVLRDHMYTRSSGVLILDMHTDRKMETIASLQQILELVYERVKYVRASDVHKNDLLLDLMYSLLTTITDLEEVRYIRIEEEPEHQVHFLNDEKDIVKSIREDKGIILTDMYMNALIDLIGLLSENDLIREETKGTYRINRLYKN